MEMINTTIALLTAYKDRKRVEYRANGIWYGCSNMDIILKYIINGAVNDLRIAPEKKYRPYINAEEFLKASKEHGPYFHSPKPNSCYFFAGAIEGVEITVPEHMKGTMNFEYLCKTYIWQDGHPCGILEE